MERLDGVLMQLPAVGYVWGPCWGQAKPGAAIQACQAIEWSPCSPDNPHAVAWFNCSGLSSDLEATEDLQHMHPQRELIAFLFLFFLFTVPF